MSKDRKPTIKDDRYEIHYGYRIRVLNTASGKRYQVDLGRKSGQHIRKSFKVLQEARNWSYKKRIEAENKGIAAQTFTDVQKNDAVEAMAILKEFGVNLRTAAKHYAKHHRKVDRNNGTSYLVDQYIEDRKDRLEAGTLRPATYNDTVKRLKPFKNQLGHLAVDSISKDDIGDLLKAYKPSNAANYKRYISMFFRWAMREGKVLGNPVELLDRIKLEDQAPGVYEPNQVKDILYACINEETPRKDMVPYFALAFFGGVRPEEVLRLEWKDINLEEGIIHIQATVAKTKKSRFIEMPDNLRQWLSPWPRKEGLIFPWSDSSLKRWRSDIYKKAGAPSIQDGARHSMATYYLALHTIEETTDLLGHSDKVLFRHYKGLVKGRKTKAAAYFSIKPDDKMVSTLSSTGL